MSEWTKDFAQAWEQTWALPYMQEGLKRLKEMAEADPTPIVQGYDALVLAAGEHHRKVGQQEILKGIEKLKTANTVLKQTLPQPFTREARGEKPPE